MDHALTRALVRTILEHAADFPWKIQDIGLLGLWLDDAREHRLHVWDPDGCVGDPPIHDHPFDFTSTIVVGELVNTRYLEDANGVDYHRERYTPPNDEARRNDTVRLVGTSTTLRAGETYEQLAPELHDSRQRPGTVTVIRFSFERAPRELSICHVDDSPADSGKSRPATSDEVKRITTTALELFDV
jgi:hypothetical protein